MNKYRFTILLLLGFLLGCMSSQQVPRLPEGALLWSSQRKITWDDFQGNPINSGGQTVCEIALQNPAYFMKSNLFSKDVVIGDCYMDRKHSWADKTKVTNQLLLYNQTMFDIYELHARKLRQRFDNTSFGLGNQSEVFNQAVQDNQNELLDTLKQYRTETKLGADSSAMRDWASRIAGELSELSQYERK